MISYKKYRFYKSLVIFVINVRKSLSVAQNGKQYSNRKYTILFCLYTRLEKNPSPREEGKFIMKNSIPESWCISERCIYWFRVSLVWLGTFFCTRLRTTWMDRLELWSYIIQFTRYGTSLMKNDSVWWFVS